MWTIEGNSGDRCREKSYPLEYYKILGYVFRRNKTKQPPFEAAVLRIIRLIIKSGKKLIIRAVVYLSKFNQYTCTNVKLTSFVFGIAASGNITPTALQFCT